MLVPAIAGMSFRGLFGLLSSISRLLLTLSIVRPCGSCYAALVTLSSKVVDLMEALYTDACRNCVCADGVLSDWFTVGSGVQ